MIGLLTVVSDFNASELSVLTEVDLPEHRAGLNQIIGAKATELFGVPSLWRLPIAVVPTVVYATWKQAKVGCDREKVLVAVAEMALASNIGAQLYADSPTAAYLFGEDQSCYIVTGNYEDISIAASEHGIQTLRISRLRIDCYRITQLCH